VSSKELAANCNRALDVYVRGNLAGFSGDPGSAPFPPIAGIRRRRPALLALEVGDLSEEVAVEGGSVPLETDDGPRELLVDFCGLEDFVVLEEVDPEGRDAVEVSLIWVARYPASAPSPAPGIPAVNFTDDVGAAGLPPNTIVVSPTGSGEPDRVALECRLMLEGRLGEEIQNVAISMRVVSCAFEEIADVKNALLARQL
jgi:hypothetical protein